MKKVLFITYFWPPSGKATIHWPLKIIKHLPEFGWQPSVLTVEEETFTQKDESLLKEIDPNLTVIKSSALEPFDIYRKFIGKKKDEQLIASETISKENKNLAHRISIWIRMNIFVPDARVGWYFTAVNAGSKLLQKEKFDAIISIGPPHSSHLIGLRLSKKFNIPYIPVLIDPWVDIIYYKDFKRSKPTLAVDNYFEKKVLRDAKEVVFVTQTTEKEYLKKYKFLNEKSHVLYWGYNEEDFQMDDGRPKMDDGRWMMEDGKRKTEEIILHAGNIFDYQNPKNFWSTIKEEIDKGRKLKLEFIGTVGPEIKKSISEVGLDSFTEYKGFLPYKEMLSEMMKASYLLVCASEKRHVPGKLFEYLRSGQPIIAFGEDNEEVKEILKNANAGMMFGYAESGRRFFSNLIKFKTDLTIVSKFDRERITKALTEIIK